MPAELIRAKIVNGNDCQESPREEYNVWDTSDVRRRDQYSAAGRDRIRGRALHAHLAGLQGWRRVAFKIRRR